jgi:hypothetical protein
VVLNRTPGEAGYAEAGATFEKWRAEGLVGPDPEPALYVLEQSFATEGRTLRRFGILARFRAVDPKERVVLPHEHTRAAAREDRFKVLTATRANFSPIFLMFPDPERRFTQALAEAMSVPAFNRYAVWAIYRFEMARAMAKRWPSPPGLACCIAPTLEPALAGRLDIAGPRPYRFALPPHVTPPC